MEMQLLPQHALSQQKINPPILNPIYQEKAKQTVSSQYYFVDTKRVIDILGLHGWLVSSTQIARANKPQNNGFQRHLVRFQNKDIMQFNGNIAEIVMINSHNATSSLRLCCGILRMCCLNGLFVADSIFAEYKITHKGFQSGEVTKAINGIVGSVPMLSEKVSQFSDIHLNNQEKLILADSTAGLNWENDSKPQPQELLRIRRPQDREDNLYTVYNVIQENLIKGGINVPVTHNPLTERNTGKTRKSKAIKSIPENVRLNKSLWSLTEKMAQLKG